MRIWAAKRLTYANVMATIAVFMALGGTSFALSAVAANSVGSKQLKKGAVTNSKLASGAVTGAKVASGSLTGTQIKSSTLGTVPDATNASTAAKLTGNITGSQVSSAVANATNAITATNLTGSITGSQVSSAVANATSAANVGGFTFTQISGSTNANTDDVLLDNFGGLTLDLRCAGGDADIDASSATSGASFGIGTVNDFSSTNFSSTTDLTSTPLTVTNADTGQVSFSYQLVTPTGTIIAEQRTELVSGTFTILPGSTCSAFGDAEASATVKPLIAG